MDPTSSLFRSLKFLLTESAMSAMNKTMGDSSPIEAQTPTLISKCDASTVRSKVDLHLIPVVSILYLLCFIDRANLGMSSLRHIHHGPVDI